MIEINEVKNNDTDMKKWLDWQVELRKQLSEACKVDDKYIAYDEDASYRMMIYDFSVLRILASECNKDIEVEYLNSDQTAHKWIASFEYRKIKIQTFLTNAEYNMYFKSINGLKREA